jgi:D-sedoheptulose 7-phosphate isomerase
MEKAMFERYLFTLKTLLDRIETTSATNTASTTEMVKEVVARIEKLYQSGNQLFWIGNGGSATIAEHSALDFFRTADIKSRSFYDGPFLTCLSNDFGYAAVFQKPLEIFAAGGDILMAISSSGRSVNILNAVSAAAAIGCYIITLSGFAPDNPLRKLGDINFYVPVCHYGYVELIHGILCHSFLDLLTEQRTQEDMDSANRITESADTE